MKSTVHPLPIRARRLLRDQLFDALRDQLVDGRLQPGAVINDDQMAREFGVSRTPIREALQQLSRAGLVETSPNRYTKVTDVIDDELVPSLTLLGEALAYRLGEVDITPEQRLELTYRIGLADVDGQDAVGRLRAIFMFLLQLPGSRVIGEFVELALPRVLRLLTHHPALLDQAGVPDAVDGLLTSIGTDTDLAAATIRDLCARLAGAVGRIDRRSPGLNAG
ncbi:GntR family transcriptional regulator [Leifsonia aquatica]|uniref:GntR family transcriptional regulator n=1 Tax=Leifsonia aquatica TaxID=144185 RepID=UPI00384B69F4